MANGLVLVLVGLLVRQIDHWWFSPYRRLPGSGKDRPACNDIVSIKRLQRARANDYTPACVVIGHWLEIVGLWVVGGAADNLAVWMLIALLVSIEFRCLQEVSHYAVHRSLCRTRRVGDLLANMGFQFPLALRDLTQRRVVHVRRHHPNAIIPGVDPNLEDLADAGLSPGCTKGRFILGVLFPMTPRGVYRTGRDVWQVLTSSRQRKWVLLSAAAMAVGAYLLGGPLGLAFGFLIPRILIYPELSWISLLVEHRWFDRPPDRGNRVSVEAARCQRLYHGKPVLEALAGHTLLPYGDLRHFAHSAYPMIRWNYLRAVERVIGHPQRLVPAIFFGPHSSLAYVYRSTVLGEAHDESRAQPHPL
ncbi:fatty acid desaturase [Streptosporangium vulgare]|uniref:Fatty acid desaturase n=1 Tax=Streptosporangium vulgare TaxID=46190 RepID=A0ABV5TA77_9ACTN